MKQAVAVMIRSSTTTVIARSQIAMVRTCSGPRHLTPHGTSIRVCKRRPLWTIDGIGIFCNHCFDDYMVERVIHLDRIHRLSDDDRDFITANGK